MADVMLPKDHWTYRAARISKGLPAYIKASKDEEEPEVPEDLIAEVDLLLAQEFGDDDDVHG